MEKLMFFALSVFLLSSCTEKETIRFVDEYAPDVLKYEIKVSGNRITSYSTYVNDTLAATTDFIFKTAEIEKITKSSAGNIIQRIIYTLGNDGFATSSIDSNFGVTGLAVTNVQYTYNGSRLHSKEISWIQSGDHPDSSMYALIFETQSGNFVSIETSPVNYQSCTDYYEYNSLINKLDIESFSNLIEGEINTNLIDHISWHPDCHSAPSTSEPYSDYSYELDENGYVVKKVEVLTPGYHSDATEVTRTVKTTLYEYSFF